MNKLLVFYCITAYAAMMGHLGIFAYKIGGMPEIKNMVDRFTPQQTDVYNEIKKERRMHYLVGLAIGLIVASWFVMKNHIPSPKKHICAFVGLATFVANTFYELMPKSEWMVEHLDNAGDVKRWNVVYRKFRTLTGYGELLGFILFAVAH